MRLLEHEWDQIMNKEFELYSVGEGEPMKSLRQRSDVAQCRQQNMNFSGNGENESLEVKRFQMEILNYKQIVAMIIY